MSQGPWLHAISDAIETARHMGHLEEICDDDTVEAINRHFNVPLVGYHDFSVHWLRHLMQHLKKVATET